jgi:hypothetical protein
MSEVEALFEWDVDICRLPELRERLRSRPDYPKAARQLARNMIRDAESDQALDGLLKDAGRTVAGLSAAYLSAAGGVTLSRLRGFIAGFGLVSPGRARTLLSYMQYLGYVEPDPAWEKKKPTIYRLTEPFYASYTRHEVSLVDAVTVVEPVAGRVRDNLADIEIFNRLVTEQGDAFVAGSAQAQPFRAWYEVFLHRYAGIQILHSLVAQADDFPPRGAVSIPISATARRFKVSRAHVTRMIEASVEQGYMAPDAGGHRFTEAGREALDWLYANRLCIHLACVARTLKANPELGVRSAA